jgi:hypothetical protein
LANNDQLQTKAFINELSGIYKDISGRPFRGIADSEIADFAIGILRRKGTFDLEKISTFAFQNKERLKHIITSQEDYLSSQPVIILLAFLVARHNSTLRSEWKYPLPILENIYFQMGTSLEN